MTKPNEIKLLEFLNKSGIGVLTNISPLLSILFPKPNVVSDIQQWNSLFLPSQLFVKDIKARGFIQDMTKDKNIMDFVNLPVESGVWFEGIVLEVFITSYGVDYLNQYKTRRSAKWSKIISWFALGIAAVSAFFTGWASFSKHNVKPEETISPSVKSMKQLPRTPIETPKTPNKNH